MVFIKLKWGKATFDMNVDPDAPVAVFRAQIQSLTGVPAQNQKIMGLRAPLPADDGASISGVGLADGKTLMLIGSAEVLPSAPHEVPSVGTAAITGAPSLPAEGPVSDGLQNIGNTCYLNSAVQMLRAIPQLRAVLRLGTKPVEKQLLELLTTLDSAKEPVIPFQFWTAFIQRFTAFGQRDDHGQLMQHDSQEALGSILQDIKANIIDRDSSGGPGAGASPWERLFQGELVQTTSCEETFQESPLALTHQKSYVPFTMLSCNINEEVQTLEAGLERAFREQMPAMSAELSREVAVTRTSLFSKLPEFLIVHMVRFSWRNDIKAKAKILKPITFPLVLDVHVLCSEELRRALAPEREVVRDRRDRELERRRRLRQKTDTSAESSEAPPEPCGTSAEQPSGSIAAEPPTVGNVTGYYELCGVISHKGRSADGGHYVYWGKKTDKWLVYDDRNVAAVSEDDILRLRGSGEAHIAYVLLYRSRNPETNLGPLPL